MTMKNEFEEETVQKSTEEKGPLEQQNLQRTVQKPLPHSISELLQVAIDMGDEKVIEALKKKINQL